MLEINEIYKKGLPFDGHYKLTGLLSGAGGSADVWLAIDLNTVDDPDDESLATKVVIKIYRPKNMIDIEGEYQFRKEFKQVFGCHHENIIQPTYFSIFQESPYLVLPYCPEGSSDRLIGKLNSKDGIYKYILDVASGLAYLHDHSPRIIHQDIKPANVLIDDNGNYAITDFGISAAMGGNDIDSEDETGGTFAYMAPERFTEGTPPMPESDIWALGATLYELITGDAPYGNEGGGRQIKGERIPPIKQDIPDEIKQLIYSCLAYDAKDRPSAREIVDTVLKKKYSRKKRTIIEILAAVAVIVIGIIFYFTTNNSKTPHDHLNSLMVSADSIVSSQISIIEYDNGEPSEDNITEFKKAIILYSKVSDDAPAGYEQGKIANSKIQILNELIYEIEEYDFTDGLVEGAMITEMEDSVIKYSVVRDNIKLNINRLTERLK